MPTGVKLCLSAVVGVGGPHRADDRNLVDIASGVRKPVAHLDAALSMFFVADLQWKENVPLIAVGIGHRGPLFCELVRILYVGVGRFFD